MKNLFIMALGAFAYEYLKTNGYIKGFTISKSQPLADQAVRVLAQPMEVFKPVDSARSQILITTPVLPH